MSVELLTVYLKQRILVESTNGNIGIDLAFIIGAKDYKLIVTLLASINLKHQIILKAFGIELVFNDLDKKMKDDIQKIEEIVKKFLIHTSSNNSRTQKISKYYITHRVESNIITNFFKTFFIIANLKLILIK